MSLPIVTVPNPILRQPSLEITSLDTNTVQFIHDLTDTLKYSKTPGVGISAVQVGVVKRVFITAFPEDPDLPLKKWHQTKPVYQAIINPKIIKTSPELSLGNDRDNHQIEGCLSIPQVWGHVWRHLWVEVRYQLFDPGSSIGYHDPGSSDDPGSYITTRFSGFAARVIQHEYDHLDGILFTDHILGKSPIPGFKPLKPHTGPLYFDLDGDLTPIEDPLSFAKW